VAIPEGKKASDCPTVWKIFSQTPLTEEELDHLFTSRQETKVADWLAYPQYEANQRATLGEFKLHSGLYYTSAVEFAFSAMETAVLAGRNVANAVRKEFLLDDFFEKQVEASLEMRDEL